jgi:CGNR zinc finger
LIERDVVERRDDEVGPGDGQQIGIGGPCHADTSANHSRRWCSMDACGAIEKMRRHRAKH